MRRANLLVAGALLLAGCSLPLDIVDQKCPVLNGYTGCAAVVVLIDRLPDSLPDAYLWSVGAEVRSNVRIEGRKHGGAPMPGEIHLRAIRRWAPPEGIDTATVRLAAGILDTTGIESSVSPPEVAFDSTSVTLRFVPPGQHPDLDTVRFSLQPVEPDSAG